MHDEKENKQENFRNQQEEGGSKSIANIGDHAECPECSRMGHVVWVSKDGKSAGIRCRGSHSVTNHPQSRFGPVEHARPRTSKNVVFITEIK
ncbi:MAG TPA: hypothetical protein VF893_08490 [Candidatus Bathyarchaeia archaeon]